MKNENIYCPCCGSSHVVRHEQIVRSNVTLGSEFSHKEIYYSCNLCKEEIDVFSETYKSFLESTKDAHTQFVIETIKELTSKRNISIPLFERVFELPFGTLSRWKEGRYSASTLALLRIVKSCPWIVEVADHGFDNKWVIDGIKNAAEKNKS